jgi:hypothetical protein
MKHRNVPWPIRVISFIRPRIHSSRLWMTYQVKHFYNSIPNGFSVKFLVNWYALSMRRLCFM